MLLWLQMAFPAVRDSEIFPKESCIGVTLPLRKRKSSKKQCSNCRDDSTLHQVSSFLWCCCSTILQPTEGSTEQSLLVLCLADQLQNRCSSLGKSLRREMSFSNSLSLLMSISRQHSTLLIKILYKISFQVLASRKNMSS